MKEIVTCVDCDQAHNYGESGKKPSLTSDVEASMRIKIPPETLDLLPTPAKGLSTYLHKSQWNGNLIEKRSKDFLGTVQLRRTPPCLREQ